jgi:hypothetical protein
MATTLTKTYLFVNPLTILTQVHIQLLTVSPSYTESSPEGEGGYTPTICKFKEVKRIREK